MTSALRLADAPDSDQERRNRPRLGGNGGAERSGTISLSDGRPLSTGREGASGAFSGAVLGAVLIMGGLPLVGWWYSGGDTMVRVTTGDTQLEGVLSSDRQREDRYRTALMVGTAKTVLFLEPTTESVMSRKG